MDRGRPGISPANLRHLARMLKQGRRPASTVYDSIGSDFFLSPAPGWLNLGLWEGEGDEREAEAAVHRLVRTLALELPTGGTILDVANGLGAQDPVIAEVTSPRLFVAVNITESQLRAGRDRLDAAEARPVLADAVHLPVMSDAVDGVISVEAAFHFSSRERFFNEVRRVLRPGGRLAMSDIAVERQRPRTVGEAVAGISNLRTWGVRRRALQSASEIRASLDALGFTDIEIRSVGDRVLVPAIAFMRGRLQRTPEAPALHRFGAKLLLNQWELLYRRGMMDYILTTATAAR
ncbi:MAG: methyltransferase domain-containing protein [Actinobacteria bacterium]|nr:methyltransferase domain-containing protein [Actinomycetota bacterium]